MGLTSQTDFRLVHVDPTGTRVAARGHWSPVSAKVHGIRGRDLLAHGRSPRQIAFALNEAPGAGAIGWCDGGPYDAQWIGGPFKAGGVKPLFALGDCTNSHQCLVVRFASMRSSAWSKSRRDIGRVLTRRSCQVPWPVPWMWKLAPSKILIRA